MTTPPNHFDAARTGTGTREWSEHSFNFGTGCSHGCRYCYARQNALRFGMIRKASDWERERIKYGIRSHKYTKKSGVIMTPTMTDITPFYLNEAIIAFRSLLEAGNNLLVVSKPHIVCIQELCEHLAEWKSRVLFRFTIGTTDDRARQFWEPGAPDIAERMECLMYAREYGWQTSVSAEPLLGGYLTAMNIVEACLPYVTDTLWLGRMNAIRRRVDCTDTDVLRAVKDLEHAQRDAEMLRLYDDLRDNLKIRFKESITKTVNRLEGQ
jgi:DNA repair photolyase